MEKRDRPKKGLTVLAEALAMVDKNGERLYEAELYRLHGELTLPSRVQSQVGSKKAKAVQSSRPQSLIAQEAEECFLKAIEIAQRQQAKSLELRAVMSLVRLRQQQAAQHVSCTTQHEAHTRLDAAHNMLAEIYNWFTEGFDTKDLQEAKALLEKLT